MTMTINKIVKYLLEVILVIIATAIITILLMYFSGCVIINTCKDTDTREPQKGWHWWDPEDYPTYQHLPRTPDTISLYNTDTTVNWIKISIDTAKFKNLDNTANIIIIKKEK